MTEISEGRRTQRWWWLMAVLSILVAVYAIGFTIVGREAFYEGRIPVIGLDAASTAIGVHALAGTVALGLGPFQFLHRLRVRRPGLHRAMGRFGVVAMILTGLSGLFVAMFALGGPSGKIGFALLGVSTAAAAGVAWRQILMGRTSRHRVWMIRAFALILAAVSLRLQLPALFWIFGGDPMPVFAFVAWSCWVPNLVVAEWWIRRTPEPIGLGRQEKVPTIRG